MDRARTIEERIEELRFIFRGLPLSFSQWQHIDLLLSSSAGIFVLLICISFEVIGEAKEKGERGPLSMMQLFNNHRGVETSHSIPNNSSTFEAFDSLWEDTG